MAVRDLTTERIPRAPRGSKKGWVSLPRAEVPADLYRRFLVLVGSRKAHQGDVIREAVEQYLDRAAA